MNLELDVSLIVPCRNEKNHIIPFLDNILSLDFDILKHEILLVDGASDDGTKEIILNYIKDNKSIKYIENPDGFVSQAMNLGIKHAKGDVIFRLDVHAIYPSNYILKLYHYLVLINADSVGGYLETIPANNTKMARSISIALSSPFGVGNVGYRINSKNFKEYYKTDTVPFGCFRRDVFLKFGMFDTDLIRNQDNELNERIISNGGKIYVIPEVKVKYFARSTYSKLFAMLFQYGYFGPIVDLKLKRPTRLRRYIPSIFVLSIVGPIILAPFSRVFLMVSISVFIVYIVVNFLFSLTEAVKRNSPLLAIYIVLANVISHFGYGIGYIVSFLKYVVLRRDYRIKNLNTNR